MEGGIFTLCLHIVRRGLNFIPKIFEWVMSLPNGVVAELVALATIWIVCLLVATLIDKLSKAFLYFLKKFEK